MRPQRTIRDILKAYRHGSMSLDEAEKRLTGLNIEMVEDIARLDIGRDIRCGMPEIVLAEGKNPKDLAAIALRCVKTQGRCIISRVQREHITALRKALKNEEFSFQAIDSAGMVIISNGSQPLLHRGTIGILSAGTADIRVAEEVRVVANEMGCSVKNAYDVGVAGIHRLFSALKEMADVDVFVVVAGREGTLPAIVAGLVDRPVIGVPVSTGYGYMGKGEAALASMLQSCSILAVVNIDAGVIAGAFAARIAKMVTNHD